MSKKLTMDARSGLYRRDLGVKANGQQPRFYLGRDAATAAIANQRLELLWQALEEWFVRHRDGERPVWEETTLQIAWAVARGEFICRLDVPHQIRHYAETDGSDVIHGWLNDLREAFGTVIDLQLADGGLAEQAERAQADRAEYHQKIGQRLKGSVGKASTGETLHRAIDAYITWLEGKFLTPPEEGQEQRTSQTGKKQAERAHRLKEHHKNIQLSDFGAKEINAVIAYWASRPKTRKGKHYCSGPASTRSGFSNTSSAGFTRTTSSRGRNLWTTISTASPS